MTIMEFRIGFIVCSGGCDYARQKSIFRTSVAFWLGAARSEGNVCDHDRLLSAS